MQKRGSDSLVSQTGQVTNEGIYSVSLILDALNRSQRERDNKNDIPGLETQHPVEILPAPVSWRRWLPWAGLVAALGVIAWLVLDREDIVTAPVALDPPAVAVAPPVPLETRVAEVEVARVARVEPTAQREPVKNNREVEELYNKPVEKELATQAEEQSQQTAEPDERPIDIEEIISKAEAEVEQARMLEHTAPFLSELSQQTKNQIPTIYYSLHDYSANPAQSRVILNGENVRAGATLAGSLKLEEILPDSIVLSHRGTQFRLRALNSWINL